MGRFTGLKRKIIFRLGELLYPRRKPRPSPKPGKRERLRLFLNVLAGLVFIALILALAGQKLIKTYRAQQEPLAELEKLQTTFAEAKALNERLITENERLQKTFSDTREDMMNQLNFSNPENQKLLSDYQTALVMAGMTEYKGPGIRVVLQDKEERSEDLTTALKQIVHDADLRYVVDWFKQHHAAAIAVNGERLAPMSPLICTGPSVLVNRVYKASPFVIDAGGDGKKLAALFTESQGYKLFTERGLRISIETFDKFSIAAQRDMTYVNAQAERLEGKK